MADTPNITVQQWLDKVNAANHSMSALTGKLIGGTSLGSPIPDGLQAASDKLEEAVQALKDAIDAQTSGEPAAESSPPAPTESPGHNAGKAKKK